MKVYNIEEIKYKKFLKLLSKGIVQTKGIGNKMAESCYILADIAHSIVKEQELLEKVKNKKSNESLV